MKHKLVVYKKGEEYHLIVSLFDLKQGEDYLISEDKYKKSIAQFEMKNVPSIWDECYEINFE